jgi:UDP:flavonoid glycosyltransferase YjiC (YdhE family)
VHALGAGPLPLPQKRLNSRDLAQAISEALRPETAARAEKLGAAIRAEAGPATAAKVLSALDRLGPYKETYTTAV